MGSGQRSAYDVANRILIISADAADAAVLQDVLGKAKDGLFIIEWLTCLADALDRLNRGDIDAILTALSLPDCQGLETFDQLFALAPIRPSWPSAKRMKTSRSRRYNAVRKAI
ncbi:hypothetical protein [Pseudomonas sp. CC6-YY-74]|uniref:hypothetical protein n=1 Tax=Pseudomonas sp. CC6-YY-74 TaxID=1930532 RepID=UPI001C46B737|nr:hypothetical protein [Pseudomonas sp. CC6-YY-74]